MDAFNAAIDLYNKTLDRAWTSEDFIKELIKEGFSEDEVQMAYLKLRYQLKTPNS